MNYFAKIKYLGTDFRGFQVQPSQRTVQGELCAALKQALGVDVKVTGCSRTDSGVHANEFCVRIDADGSTVPSEKLPVAVARFLPRDLALYYAVEVDESFHPRYDVKMKEYLYRIRPSRISDPFDYHRVWFLPQNIDAKAISLMRVAASQIIGTHDFTAFMSEGSDVLDTVRTVYSLEIIENGDYVDVKISADGFLYNMVRIIVGTLVSVAAGRISPSSIADIIESKDRARAGMTAPADGLYLNRVIY